jgi:hypothetical protein
MGKRYMKKEHFKELLAGVGQMGDYLRGKRVPGVRVTCRPKPVTAREVGVGK